jgi:cytochrome b561
MRHWLMALVLSLTIATSAQAYSIPDRVNDDDYGSSYAVHYTVGATVGGLAWYLLPEDWNPWARGAVSIGTSFLVGLAVELTDDPFTGADVLDYGLGGAVSVTILTVAF